MDEELEEKLVAVLRLAERDVSDGAVRPSPQSQPYIIQVAVTPYVRGGDHNTSSWPNGANATEWNL